jgi:hypothetical protein
MKLLMAASLVVLLSLNSALAAEPAPIATNGPESAAPSLRVPEGFRAVEGTMPEPYTNTGLPKEIVHEATGIEMALIPAGGDADRPASPGRAPRWGQRAD